LERRCGGGEPEIARGGHLDTGAEAGALRGQDDRLVDRFEFVVEPGVLEIIAAILRRRALRDVDVGDVDAGSEVRPDGADHQHP
jgi:hypothetical protein